MSGSAIPSAMMLRRLFSLISIYLPDDLNDEARASIPSTFPQLIELSGTQGVQRKLSSIIEASIRTRFLAATDATTKRIVQASAGPLARAWLSPMSVPGPFEVPDADMKHAVRLRLGLPPPADPLLPESCPLCLRQMNGWHGFTCQAVSKHQRHNSICRALGEACRAAGFIVVSEPHTDFSARSRGGSRADLLITDGYNTKMIDVKVLHPLAASYANVADPLSQREDQTVAHYRGVAPEVEATPFVISTLGEVGAESLFRQIADHAKQMRRPFDIPFWRTRLSVALQRRNHNLLQLHHLKMTLHTIARRRANLQ